jgi:hypothetical protein
MILVDVPVSLFSYKNHCHCFDRHGKLEDSVLIFDLKNVFFLFFSSFLREEIK